jgi:diguanylate cyclase (GGDEF)-like protein/PAS domain S-box-containing protein
MNRGLTEEALTVLVVDDDPVMRQMIREVLEEQGCKVAEAKDGEEGLSAFSRLRPDLILMDVIMPKLDGFDACRRLRGLPSGEHIPVLMMTGLDDKDSIKRAYGAGATDFITKPINWELLAHRLRFIQRAGRAFQELRISREELAHAQRLARLGSWIGDFETGEVSRSDEVCRIFGLAPGGLPPTRDAFMKAVHPEDKALVRKSFNAVLHQDKAYDVEFRIVLPDGTERIVHEHGEVIRDQSGKPIKMRGTVQDITEKKRAQQQIRYLAYYDSLTDLPNRRLFQERLQRALARAKRHECLVAVLFLDLDRFKRINDVLGHIPGDQLLQIVAKRLRRCVRTDDVVTQFVEQPVSASVARMGGDEFIILLDEIGHAEDAARIARRVLKEVGEPIRLSAEEVCVTASIGIALYPADGDDVDVMLKKADAAMYHAKAEGRNNYQFFDESINTVAIQKLSLESHLRKALDREEFRLYYQPQIDTVSGKITGFEALIRWQHPDLGLMLPGQFIQLAEDTGLIVPIGDWVVRTASKQIKAWQAAGFPPVRVSVNLSAVSFKQKDLAGRFIVGLSEAGVDPRCLEVEITESTLMEDADVTLGTLRKLKEIGLRLAIDDFGTGYSSLSYLQQFPLDTLKIDRSFIKDISVNRNSAAIARTIVLLAQNLRLGVVAEGVETHGQLALLRTLGCKEAQGYFFSRPVPAEGATEMLRTRKQFSAGEASREPRGERCQPSSITECVSNDLSS